MFPRVRPLHTEPEKMSATVVDPTANATDNPIISVMQFKYIPERCVQFLHALVDFRVPVLRM